MHLWHKRGTSRADQNLGQARRLEPGQPGVREPLRRAPAAPLQVRPRGWSSSAQARGEAFSSTPGLGRAKREKARFSFYSEGTEHSLTPGLGPGSFFAPFRAAGVDTSEPGYFLNRPLTSKEEGARATVPSIELQVPKGQLSA